MSREQQTEATPYGMTMDCYDGRHRMCDIYGKPCSCRCHSGEPTPPATPQTWTAVERAVERMAERKVQQYRIDGYPELADVVWGFWYDTVRGVLRGQLVALSPPPDVERLTIEQIRDRVQTLPVTDMGGEDMVDLHDVLTLFPLFPSTPGEGQP